ncbi:MFS transporter [Tessaracoccus antarcticus]|uniref:MFS transporter n=1 Tax=Tessaracoccus antarcticus TaxID=2479848 RepID=A0A3M0G8X2_9ACTN|nr:MFS transporter [Tessaracoccus antarcticus]
MSSATATEIDRPTRSDWIGLWVLALALAMIVLDGTIVGVALPVIIRDLGLSLTEAQWINSLYSVVFAALLLTFGRLGDRFGRRRLMIAGVALFMLGSVLAAMATTGDLLIASRAVQGVGGALILPSTLSTVNASFRGKDRAAAFGVWGAVMSGAAAVGPLLGGWLTQVASWPWIFWVNIPLGLGVIIAATFFVSETRATDHGQGYDILGPILSALGFGALVFGLIEGSSLGWWSPKSPFTIGSLSWPMDAALSPVPVSIAAGAILIAGFVWREARRTRRRQSAMLDTTLFRIPTFAWGNLTAGLVAVGEFSLVFILPLHLVNSLGLDVLGAGLVLAAMAAGAFIAGASARHLSARFGSPNVVVLGLALELIGIVGTALVVGMSLSPWLVALVLLPYGIGLGLASAQLTSTVLRDVPINQSGSGSAVQSTVRQVGSALGSAVGGTALAIALGSTNFREVDAAQFASAAGTAVWAAAVVLALGLGSALLVRRAAQR